MQALTERPSLPAILDIIKNPQRLRILGCLMEKPYNMKELQNELKTRGHYYSIGSLHCYYLQPLIDGHLVREDNDIYRINGNGQSIYNLFINSDL